jgi:uncharacterized protein (TIGR00730 family)
MPSEDHKLHTLEEIRNSCQIRFGNDGELIEVCRVSEELVQGIDIVNKYDKLATVYGSARFSPEHPMYEEARRLSRALVEKAGYGVITGGSHGIMEGANRGAFEADGVSIGATIVLPNEQTTNPYVTEIAPFEYFFTRKTVLRYSSEIAIYMPGGFGTLDELFDLLTLVQTRKIKKVPVILFGSSFWNPLVAFIKQTLIAEWKTVSDTDMELFVVTDSIDEVVEIAKKTPSKQGAISDN